MKLSPNLDAVNKNLHDLGYRNPSGATISEYKYLIGKGKNRLGSIDLIAFGDTQTFDISTSCIAVEELNKEVSNEHKLSIISDLVYIGTPIVLFALPDHIEIWPVSTYVESLSNRGEKISYQELPEYFDRNGRELSPRSLLSAKNGERQLSLFDIDHSLVEFAREATQEILVEQFEAAILSTPLEIRKIFPKELSRLAVWILAARILQDKLIDNNLSRINDVISLLEVVQNLFPNYFTTLQQDLSLIGSDTANRIYKILSGDFTFRSLTNDMLAYFYENTLVDEETRKALGIYYTPRAIAQRILHRLPLEDLPPNDRFILDGTCGSGNLLLASYDRLAKLLPFKWSAQRKHEYLLNHLWGIDQDNFACEIARLSLLLYNLPSGDNWKINNADVFQVKPIEMFGQRPNVIVGNPPFKESTDPEANNKRIQKAAQIVELYLEWLAPGGLMGVVLPLTFLHNPSAKASREKLLNLCEILEIWHLPEGAFSSSSIATAVILARKFPSSLPRPNSLDHLVRVNQVFNISKFSNKREVPPLSYVVAQSQWLSDSRWQMTSSWFDDVWRRVENQFLSISPTYCEILNGIKIGKLARPTHLSEENKGVGWRPVLNKNLKGKILEPFLINWQKQHKKYIKYPSYEIERGRNEEHFSIPRKVIINATRNSSNPWRFYAAIDSGQLVVTENFNYVLPKNATCEELVAVFNSMLANAWFSSHVYQRDIKLTDSLNKLPFPKFSIQQRNEIEAIVSEIEYMKKVPSMVNKRLQIYVNQLDEIIFDAYEVSLNERKQIRQWMNLFPRPGLEWKGILSDVEDVKPYQGRHWIITGQVEDVHMDTNRVLLWIDGTDNSIELNIPPTMPGWALRPGAAFQATTPWEQRYPSDFSTVTWLDFQPLDYGYLSNDELATYISSLER